MKSRFYIEILNLTVTGYCHLNMYDSDGYCHGYKDPDHISSKWLMPKSWRAKNLKMITSLTKDKIKFNLAKKSFTSHNEVSRDVYSLSNKVLYPTFCHYDPDSVYLLTDMNYEKIII